MFPELRSNVCPGSGSLFLVLQKNPTASCREKQQREAVRRKTMPSATDLGMLPAAPLSRRCCRRNCCSQRPKLLRSRNQRERLQHTVDTEAECGWAISEPARRPDGRRERCPAS